MMITLIYITVIIITTIYKKIFLIHIVISNKTIICYVLSVKYI